VRTDLVLTGVVFRGTLKADIHDDFGIFTPGCRRADIADLQALKIGLPDTFGPPSSVTRPFALKNVSDLVPNVKRVFAQLK
jgi:hypothetical protein